MSTQRGFTLIEILIALAILAIVSVIAVTGLESVLQTRTRINQQSAALAQLQLAVLLIERDIAQTVNRSILDEQGHTQPSLIGDEHTLEFTHGGYANPLGTEARSTLQRVQYQFQQHQLWRIAWPVLDRVMNDSTNKRLLLNNISELHWFYYDAHQHRYTTWPPPAQKTTLLPRAIELIFNYQPLGQLHRLFVLPHTDITQDNSNATSTLSNNSAR